MFFHSLFCFVFSHSYKFTLDELHPMMESVKLRAESYKDWLCNVQEILENKGNKKKGLKKKPKKEKLTSQNFVSALFTAVSPSL